MPGTDDDFATENNNCAGGVNELQDDVANFTFFMTHLAPPPPVAIVAGTAQDRGRTLFNSTALQCSGCHRNDADIFVSTTAGGIQAGIVFHPYSDFLVHDMGTLGDGIGNAGDSVAVTRRMRTAPLWGLRSRNMLLHDGRTTRSRRGDHGAQRRRERPGHRGRERRTTRSPSRRRATCSRSSRRCRSEVPRSKLRPLRLHSGAAVFFCRARKAFQRAL